MPPVSKKRSAATGKHSLLAPFAMVRKETARFSVFLCANLFVGLVGAMVAVLVPIFEPSRSFEVELIASLRSGNLYSFTIAFLTSTAVLLHQAQTHATATDQIRLWKQTALAVTLVVIALTGICAGMQALYTAIAINPTSPALILADKVELGAFCIGVLLAIYIFLLATFEEDLDTFAADEDKKREVLGDKAKAIVDDGRGISV